MMERLTGKQLRQVSEFLRQLYQLRTHDEFTSHLIAALPVITESDFVTDSTFRDTALHKEFYEPLDIPHIMGFALQSGPSRSITVAHHRNGQAFGEETRSILNAIRPHVLQGFKNALAVTQLHNQLAALDQAMEAGHRALISVSTDGRIHFAVPHASTLLKRYGLALKRGAEWLPPVLRAWLRQQIRQLAATDDVVPSITPLTINGGAGTLAIRLVPKESQYLLILEEDRPPTTDLRHLGLSARETEILGWVVQGKTNPEIGMILSISPLTIKKHLGHIYSRLGVENRHAAISLALSSMPGGA